jgi:hypothetical protein
MGFRTFASVSGAVPLVSSPSSSGTNPSPSNLCRRARQHRSHLRIAINPRFAGWIKEWLGEVAVLEPLSLRRRISTEARRGADLSDAKGAEYDCHKAARYRRLK